MAALNNKYELINRQYHEFEQGCDAWHEHRDKCFNASEIAMVLGVSPYMTRSELLKMKATGIKPEVSYYQQKIFDKGHKDERLARPFAEKILGVDLFTPIISAEIAGLLLSASYDGLCMMEINVFEHKSMNKDNVIEVEKNEPHLMYRSQMEQQLMLSGAESALFMVSSDGNEETMCSCVYHADPELRELIIESWKIFNEDLKNYVHVPETVAPVIPDIMELPALNVQIHGGITSSNLDIYKESAHKFIKEINTKLDTDQDFAVAENTVKFLKSAEDRIKLVKRQALSQTVDIEAMFNTLDKMDSEFSSKRLELDKLVKAEKENKKVAICNDANNKLIIHIDDLNENLGDAYIIHKVNFRVAIKGKRTFASIEDAANTALANAKIDVNKLFSLIETNLAHYKTAAADHVFLFMDLKTLVFKDNEAFVLIVDGRITTHKADEEKKREIEREQIDDAKVKETVETDHEAKRNEARNNRMARKENDAKEWNELTNKVHTLAKTAVAKSKKCQHTQELPLEPEKPQKATTIELMADKIAVKFCTDNKLSPDRIGVLKAYIIHGYRKLNEYSQLSNESV